jgi:signal peptidase I
MYPTLKVDDYIFVNKFTYGLHLPFYSDSLSTWSTPARGDVVVFSRGDDPMTTDNEAAVAFVKRVIGLPGETIEVTQRRVLINNEVLAEPYAVWEAGGLPEGDFGPIEVPEGQLFLLGDNRDASKDSRFWTDSHFLPVDKVKGRAFLIYFSSHEFSRIGKFIQ